MTSNWPSTDSRTPAQAIIFGLGSMFNHSTHEQNVVWERDTERQIITYRAFRDIMAGEELCISMEATSPSRTQMPRYYHRRKQR
jgi:SET domain-containing protein